MFTQQHIETIGGGNKDAFRFAPPAPMLGDPRLPIELIVHIVLLAAQELAANEASPSECVLELARVSKACHRAVLSMFLLPDLCLYGFQQIRSFAVSLDKDHIGLRAIARTRIRKLTLRARGRLALQHGYGPALFDASQAQTHFEKDLLPFIRVILSHCHALQTLHLEGVPRGLQHHFARLSNNLVEFDCLMGHFGGDIERDFWLPQRWSRLNNLQLHGPRFRLTPDTATTLAGLPQLTKLGLIVPMIIASDSSSPSYSRDGTNAVQLDVIGRVNPLQILIDQCPTLQLLLLVGHAEKDYVGYSEKYRHWLRGLRRSRVALSNSGQVRVELVTALRRYNEEDEATPRRRVHPCEVSAWMMGRARLGTQWFHIEESDSAAVSGKGELDYWTETFELADHPSNATPVTTAPTSTLMSRAGSNTPGSAAVGGRVQHRGLQRRMVEEAIEAVDMMSDDEVSSDET